MNIDLFPEGKFILQIFLRGNPFLGESYNEDIWISVVRQLQNKKRLVALVVYGSIYLWKKLQVIINSRTIAYYSPGQMPLAQKYVLNQLFDVDVSSKDKNNIISDSIAFTN